MSGAGVLACWAAGILLAADAAGPAPRTLPPDVERQIQSVIDEVDQACRRRTIYLVGPEKARRLAELVREARPQLVVECGTAIGYSGLWIARELKRAGQGRLITLEIQPEIAREAEENFRRAGLADQITVKVGDARELVRQVPGPIDFAFIDCNASNYYPCLRGMEERLRQGAVIVADNAGISARGMEDYLQHVRRKYDSRHELFRIDLPWAKEDALEITIVRPPQGAAR